MDTENESRGLRRRVTHTIRRISEEGWKDYLAEKVAWARQSWEMDNRLVGRYVEATGNQIRLHGLRISVDNSSITTGQKSTLYYGRYEVEEQQLLERHLDPSLPVVELGGCIGVVSCTVNRMLDDPSQHVVVEANPRLISTLEKNRQLNGCHFSVTNSALAYDAATVNLSVPDSFVCGNVCGDGISVGAVPATTLGAILDAHGFGAFTLVMDIEGAEVELVEREGTLLAERAAMILAELHPGSRGEARIEQVRQRLDALGFTAIDAAGDSVVWLNRNVPRASA